MKSFVRFAASTCALLALAATTAIAAAPTGGVALNPATGRIGANAGNGYSSFGYAPGARQSFEVLSDGRVRCASHGGRLVLVNVSETTFPAHASIRYALGKGSAQDVRLNAPLHAGDAVIVGRSVGERFDCAAAVRF